MLDQRGGTGPQRRHDHLVHELGVPGVQLRRRVGAQRSELEGQEGLDVERARLIVAVEAVVLALLVGGIDRTDSRQKAPPFVIAVDGQQRVVEVEQSQVHWIGILAAGVIGRPSDGPPAYRPAGRRPARAIRAAAAG